MKLSKESKNKVKDLARRFTDNKPPLCKEHSPEGLPIDKPDNTVVGDNHPAQKFENIVQNEAKKNNFETDLKISMVRLELREIFAGEFYSDSDERACHQCYNENDDQLIRMEVPDSFQVETR